MIEWLESEIEDVNQERVYLKDKIPNECEVIQLTKREGVLVLKWDRPDKDRLWLRFAVLRWYRSDCDGSNVMYTCEFHGEGPSSNLRECRHTYWGDNGYLFYPDGELIAKAFAHLSEYFDEMA